jgi:hypothetical protein
MATPPPVLFEETEASSKNKIKFPNANELD